MNGAAAEGKAFDGTVVFLRHLRDLHDPRQPGKVSYPPDEMLLLCLLAVLAGAECFTEIPCPASRSWSFFAVSARSKGGTSAHDHLGNILVIPDAEQLQRRCAAWVAAMTAWRALPVYR